MIIVPDYILVFGLLVLSFFSFFKFLTLFIVGCIYSDVGIIKVSRTDLSWLTLSLI